MTLGRHRSLDEPFMANPTPDTLTIVICTRNRAEILKDCLSALVEQKGISQAQVLVVDNNSTDHTGDVVRSFRERLPNLKHVSEPRPGIANVRNAGIANTTTEYLAYLDDDLRPIVEQLDYPLVEGVDLPAKLRQVVRVVFAIRHNRPPRRAHNAAAAWKEASFYLPQRPRSRRFCARRVRL